MSQLTRRAKSKFLSVAAASLMLPAALLAAPAAATQATNAGTTASTIADPSSRCDLKSPAQIEQSFERGHLMPISSYDDDPFVQDAIVECVADRGFPLTTDGRLVLGNSRVTIGNEDLIYRVDQTTGLYTPFAWNPWPVIALANADGSFRFPDEPRFPFFEIERGPDGKPILRDGLQVWKPNDLRRGMTTVFEAANKVKDAAEDWSGRYIPWGVDGVLNIEPQAFISFSAFYSPSARMIFFGVVPYHVPNSTDVKIFETATSWEIAAHEVGHAVLDTLKPNVNEVDRGYNTWGESFADQMEMWTQLRDPGRVRSLLAGPSLSGSNALSRIGEAFGILSRTGQPFRDAVNDAKVSTTSDEVHDRSEVLTGAVYRLFVSIVNDLSRLGGERALEEAGTIMGTFLTHTTDYTPENRMTLEDVGKAYLKVDAELFGGRYRDRLVKELRRREIFDANSLNDWLAHEAALPDLRLAFGRDVREAQDLMRRNLDRLGIGPDFGLAVQSVTRDDRYRRTIVRVQLTLGRDAGAVPLGNHGVLVFRENGVLADYHAPVPPDGSFQVQALALLDQARHLGLDRHGASLSIARKANGQLGVEARVLRGDGPSVWVDAFTLDAPHGERREVVSESWGSARQAQQLERAAIILTEDEVSR